MEIMGQTANAEKIKELGSMVDGIDSQLTVEDIDALELAKEKIVRKIFEARQVLASAKQNTEVSQRQFVPVGETQERSEKEKELILFKSAIDAFLQYAERNVDFIKNGRPEEGGRRGPSGVAFLTSALYSSRSQTKPSERGFEGDKRVVTGQLHKEQMMSDAVDKDIVLRNARVFATDAVSQVESLLNEYDNWMDIWREKSADPNFSTTDSFVEMSRRVCSSLERIKGTL